MLQVILSTASVEIKKFNYYILILLYAPYYNYTVISVIKYIEIPFP